MVCDTVQLENCDKNVERGYYYYSIFFIRQDLPEVTLRGNVWWGRINLHTYKYVGACWSPYAWPLQHIHSDCVHDMPLGQNTPQAH